MIHFRSKGEPKVAFTGKNRPQIFMTPAVHDKIAAFVKLAEGEVSWLGTVLKEKNAFLIDEIYLLEQECGAASTDISEKGLHALFEELKDMESKEGEESGVDKCNRLRFWGHSHVKMSVTPSSTDDETMKQFEPNCKDFFIRGVFNKSGETHFDFYDYDRGLLFQNMDWYIAYGHEDMSKDLEKEFTDKVKKYTYSSSYPSYPSEGGYGGWQRGSGAGYGGEDDYWKNGYPEAGSGRSLQEEKTQQERAPSNPTSGSTRETVGTNKRMVNTDKNGQCRLPLGRYDGKEEFD